METRLKPQIFPGRFGGGCGADNRRVEFDSKNAVILNSDAKVDCVFLGDSITHGCELNAYFRDLGFIVNRGINGDVAENVAKRFEGDAVQLKPRVCVILIGINNMGMYDFDPPYAEKELMELYEASCRSMLDEAGKNGIKTVLCSVLPVRGGVFNNIERRNAPVLEFNKILVRLAVEYECEYVDFHSRFVEEGSIRMKDGISRDGLHPNAIGYNIMAETLRPTLEKLLK